MRRSAAQWLEMAERVRDYRRDQLTEAQMLKLQTATGDLQARLKEKAGIPVLTKTIEKLESVMREVGGRIYPVTSLVENVDFFLVAAIVILGMRAYFVQPFKIPTNSMYPTYYGMTSEVFKAGGEPRLPAKIGRLLTLGAVNYTMTAAADGEVKIPFFANGQVAYTERPGRTMGVFPALMHDYDISVGGHMTRITVPADWAKSGDFGFDSVVSKAFFGGTRLALYNALQAAANARQLENSTLQDTYSGQRRAIFWLSTGRTLHKGESILSFDILTGDMLFVDRVTYNFFPPKVGQGFVFHTRQIAGIGVDQYYVKRLVGLPGDTLEVRRPVQNVTDGAPAGIGANDGQLFRNGKPIDGADAFVKNSNKEGLYPGYTAGGLLEFGQILKVPDKMFFAMGDNSPSSSDGRVWGSIPDKEVVGRPLFIYYPITSRWGVAR